ncbi:hypothetical protein DW064_11510 [Segatella copri]|uniref:Uncharacterized protein n=1 Tax=Segatella copri TaxID=165179 RepID=A0AA93BLU5_9BACT|nr:hypothetical protein DW064_11510 [Segatella copri]
MLFLLSLFLFLVQRYNDFRKVHNSLTLFYLIFWSSYTFCFRTHTILQFAISGPKISHIARRHTLQNAIFMESSLQNVTELTYIKKMEAQVFWYFEKLFQDISRLSSFIFVFLHENI